MPVWLLYTYIEYSSLRLSYFPQREIYLIELSLESMVQICQGLLPERTHQNTYSRAVFCERLYIDANRKFVNQIHATGKKNRVIVGGDEESILPIQEREYIYHPSTSEIISSP